MNFIKYTAFLPNGLETTAAINAEFVAQIIPFLNDAGELTHIQLLMNLPTDMGWEPYPVKGKFDKHNKVTVDKRGNQEVTFQNKQTQKHVFIVIKTEEDMKNVLAFFDYNVSSYKFVKPPVIIEGEEVSVEVTPEEVTPNGETPEETVPETV